jgi:hypothetical protein
LQELKIVSHETLKRREEKQIYYLNNKQRILDNQRLKRIINRSQVLLIQKKSRNKHHDSRRLKEIEWKNNNKNYDKIYYNKNKDLILYNVNKYRKENLQTIRLKKIEYYEKNKSKILERVKKYAIENADKIIAYRKANPHSSRSYPLELQFAMNNVRKRDNNTCQWYGCGLTHHDIEIHVNHIFPRSEYPELELIQDYMICYCIMHHIKFHEARGDGSNNFLASSLKRNNVGVDSYF